MYTHTHIYAHSQSDVEFLFGLDMLKRHRCEISLLANELRIEGASGLEKQTFLGEADIHREESSSSSSASSGTDYPNTTDKAGADSSGVVGGINGGDGGGKRSDDSCHMTMEEKLKTLEALGFADSKARAALNQTGRLIDTYIDR